MYPKTIEIERDALLGEVQAAKLLNLSTRTLQAWRIKGCGPVFVRAGRAIRYRKKDLDAWVDSITVHTKS
jgi:excisionase family DNA binding protein